MSDIKSIIFVTISMAGGGTERVIATLSNYYASQNMTVHILMIGGDEIAYELDSRVIIKSLSKATRGSLIGRLNRIKSIRKYIMDYPKAQVIAMGTVASMFTIVSAIGLNNKIVVSERNDPNRLNHRPIRSTEKVVRNILYSLADLIVFQTPMAQGLFPRYLQKKSKIILNPLSQLPEIDERAHRDNIIIAAGRLTEQKNMQLLIKAFAKAREADGLLDYHLEIYGTGEQEEALKLLIKELGISKYAHIMGFTDRLHEKMLNSKVYVSSSDWEGISNSLMEAMALGCAVIATDCPMGGSGMLIKNGYNGILISVGDEDGLKKALIELINSDKLTDSIGIKAKEMVISCNINEIARQWII